MTMRIDNPNSAIDSLVIYDIQFESSASLLYYLWSGAKLNTQVAVDFAASAKSKRK